MNSSSPSHVPTRFSNGVSIGPNTAPSVPTHTIAPIAFARSLGLGEVGGDVPGLQRRRLAAPEARPCRR